ncbi:MAG: glutamate synthase subunit beta [Candidatus Margulisbacteria bacterium]|nr:glutamate synthase subunit beta [Candidatus Margulisiibacteriota bacterium]
MGNPKGFMTVKRGAGDVRDQASRCMDCGTPFCHWGCPLGNYIPEWNDLVYNRQWERAFALLDASNNLPEVTGRICPVICEFACVLGINDDPVTIRDNELAVAEYAFSHGLVRPKPPKKRSGKKVAVVGSGPAGLVCAAQLNQAGHTVTVFEKDDKPGGIMRYGIPDFKLEKGLLDRRIDIWQQEGISFQTGVNIGVDRPVEQLQKEFDAVVLAGGSRVPRDLKVPGRELTGIHFAMDYLVDANKQTGKLTAKGKKVVVIGGGDTGADCVHTAQRQGAASIKQIEILPKPPAQRPPEQPWPRYFKALTGCEDGIEREWSVLTKEFTGCETSTSSVESLRVAGLKCVKVDAALKEMPGTEFEIDADLVLLALGFLRPEPIKGLEIELDQRGNFKTDENYMTSAKGIFAAGDMRRGQSLVVWAIYEGRQAAEAVDRFLKEKR